MIIVFIALCGVLLAVSGSRLRRRDEGWPRTFTAFTAVVAALGVGGVLVGLAVGRSTWNAWVAGTDGRETVTLGVLLVGLPLLLVLALASLVIGALSSRRRRS